MDRRTLGLLVPALVLWAVTTSRADETTGTIVGRVTDSAAEAALPAASVGRNLLVYRFEDLGLAATERLAAQKPGG